MEYKVGNGTIRILTEKSVTQTISGDEIPQNTFFYGEIDEYPDRLFVRVLDRILSLTTFKTWFLHAEFKNYKPIQVEITIKTKEEE